MRQRCIFLAAMMFPATAFAAGGADPFSSILLMLALIVCFGAAGRWSAEKLGQPSVLGELVMGVVLGNIGYWLNEPTAVAIMHLGSPENIFKAGASPTLGALWIFSNLGVIVLLFMSGLESTTRDLLAVGKPAALVAMIGVAVPFVLGYLSSTLVLPDANYAAHLFIGATLCATSVGITARVFKDLKKLQTREARMILGAAVLDDILGLVILAVVVGVVTHGTFEIYQVTKLVILSALFIGVLLFLGERMIGGILAVMHRVTEKDIRVLFSLGLAFFLSWFASLIGLAAIVGAFMAGLLLSEETFRRGKPAERNLHEILEPFQALFAPIFFVLMGMQVNLNVFADPTTVVIATLFVGAAVIGKLVAGVGAGSNSDRLTVGIGMIPRGEVGLIFASVGRGLGIVTDAVFGATIVMIMVTTLATPIALKWSLARRR